MFQNTHETITKLKFKRFIKSCSICCIINDRDYQLCVNHTGGKNRSSVTFSSSGSGKQKLELAEGRTAKKCISLLWKHTCGNRERCEALHIPTNSFHLNSEHLRPYNFFKHQDGTVMLFSSKACIIVVKIHKHVFT